MATITFKNIKSENLLAINDDDKFIDKRNVLN